MRLFPRRERQQRKPLMLDNISSDENRQLLFEAVGRMNASEDKTYSEKEVMEMLGVSEEDILNAEDAEIE